MVGRVLASIGRVTLVLALFVGMPLLAGVSRHSVPRAEPNPSHSVGEWVGADPSEPAPARSAAPAPAPGPTRVAVAASPTVGGPGPAPGVSAAPAPVPGPTLLPVLPTPAPMPPPSVGRAAFPRGAYGKDATASGFDTIAETGFNSVMTEAEPAALDPLQAMGLTGVVWLGSWSNGTCSWEHGESWVRSQVAKIAGHPAILAYYLGDEPLASRCPRGPDAFRARTALVHSLDPGRPTFTVIQAYDPASGERFPYRYWAGTVDILGLDVYPCTFKYGCDFGEIDGAIAAAGRAGIPRYWAVIQAFQDDYYRLPSPQDLAVQFDHWSKSRMSGYFVFSWNFGAVSLDTQPEILAVLKARNSEG